MRKYLFLAAAGMALVLVVLGTVPASALPTYTSGSFAYAANTSTISNVATTTLFTLTTAALVNINNPTGDFALISLPTTLPLTSLSSGKLDFTNASTFAWANTGVGSFAASSVTFLGSACLGSSCSAAYAVDGTFTFGSDWANAGGTLAAQETWSLTQTGGNDHAISMSGTFNSPPVSTPEASTSLLLGIGTLISLGYSWLRQRRG